MNRDATENTGLSDVFGLATGLSEGKPPKADLQTIKSTPAGPAAVAEIPPPAPKPRPKADPTATGQAPMASDQPRTRPFSLRLTDQERAYLGHQAGTRPLGAFIRAQLLEGRVEKRRPQRKPRADDQKIALVLAELGRSRLSANLNQLAKAANTGTLGLSATVEEELHEACQAVLSMRDNLIAALGLGEG